MNVFDLGAAEKFNHAYAIDRALEHDEVVRTEVFGRVSKVAHLEETMLREVLEENIVSVLVEVSEFFVRSVQMVLHLRRVHIPHS